MDFARGLSISAAGRPTAVLVEHTIYLPVSSCGRSLIGKTTRAAAPILHAGPGLIPGSASNYFYLAWRFRLTRTRKFPWLIEVHCLPPKHGQIRPSSRPDAGRCARAPENIMARNTFTRPAMTKGVTPAYMATVYKICFERTVPVAP